MGSELLSRVIAAASGIESSYGGGAAAAVPQSAIHMFRNTTPVRVDRNVRNLDELRPSYTRGPDIIGRELFEFTPGFLFMGHTFGGQAAFRLDPIFRMCGLAASSIGGGSTLRYVPRSSAYESGEIKVWMNNEDGDNALLFDMLGAFSTFVLRANAGEEVLIDPTLRGIYTAPTKVGSAVSATLPSHTAEVFESVGLTITPVGDSALSPQPRVLSVELNLAQQQREKADANSAKGFFGLGQGRREPNLRVVLALDDTHYVDTFEADASNAVLHDIDFIHGSVAGRRLHVTARGQAPVPELGDDNDTRIITLNYSLRHATTAEAELTLDCI